MAQAQGASPEEAQAETSPPEAAGYKTLSEPREEKEEIDNSVVEVKQNVSEIDSGLSVRPKELPIRHSSGHSDGATAFKITNENYEQYAEEVAPKYYYKFSSLRSKREFVDFEISNTCHIIANVLRNSKATDKLMKVSSTEVSFQRSNLKGSSLADVNRFLLMYNIYVNPSEAAILIDDYFPKFLKEFFLIQTRLLSVQGRVLKTMGPDIASNFQKNYDRVHKCTKECLIFCMKEYTPIPVIVDLVKLLHNILEFELVSLKDRYKF